MSPNGTVEIVDLSQSLEDSSMALSELKTAVLFNLYTTSNPEVEEELYLLDTSTLSTSHYNVSNPTRFVIHGWQSSKAEQVSTSIRDGQQTDVPPYLAVGDYNIIVVDWSTHAGSNYVTARTKIVAIGEYVGLMIDFLEAMGSSVEDMIIVGHSLGAHISGMAGRSASNTVGAIVDESCKEKRLTGFKKTSLPISIRIYNIISTKVDREFFKLFKSFASFLRMCMDPAGPLFYVTDTFARLKSTDANFVQVIHTAAGRLGYNGDLGDADYWPNGGWFQSGCGLDLFATCAHSRSYFYFAESIIRNDITYTSYACENYDEYEAEACQEPSSSIMGGSTLDLTASGDFYLKTNSEAPFALS
ncbi:pancreatic triacylglycerol lipase-like [Diprion similis]|uniref:pancreatic triacylglycerol lipase-like n=1 Tax=Diprion similis TaxID=362088 RepID=UPI001EF784E7|nr:pancreatic triacylglycerol lipase-like [Diprion similis]